MNEEEPKTDANAKKDWSRRFIDAHERWKWNAGIVVEPANSDKGFHQGTRIFPDGTRETFTVK